MENFLIEVEAMLAGGLFDKEWDKGYLCACMYM